tara:strand:+ start:19532 stop:21346 length:1815 start_codon:yes stop_codon:yes gene_type:complete
MATVTKTYQLKVETQDKQVDELNKKLETTESDITGIEEAGDKMTGGLVSGFKAAGAGLKSFGRGLKTVNGIAKASVLGVLVLTVSSLTAAFTSSEEGQNMFAKAMATLNTVVAVFTDRLAALGRGLISLFTDPMTALENFGNSFKSFIMDKIDLAIESVGFMGTAIKKLFSGDFKGALSDAGKGVTGLLRATNPLVMATEALVTSTKNLVTEMKEEAKIAGQIADQRAKADKLDRQILVDRAKANRDRADLLEKAVDKEKFTTSERIEFLKEAGALEDEITAKEIQAAQLRLDAKIAENALGDSTKEDLEEEANLRANLINLETAKLTKAKEVTSQIIALNAEEAAAKKAIDDKKIADDKEAADKKKTEEDELKALQAQIRDAEAVSEEERRALEIIKIKEHYQNLIDLAKAKGIAIGGLEKALADKLASFAEDTSKTELKWSDMTQEQKLGLAKDGLNNMATILGEESAAGKAAAIASATISTFESAQSSYKSLAGIPIIGPVLGAAAAGAAIVSGMAQVKAITSTKLPTLGGKTPPAVSGGGVSTPPLPQPPAFNTVGASDTNQLASVIGQQEQQPVKAFVVSNDVTTAQGLERNIVEGATI